MVMVGYMVVVSFLITFGLAVFAVYRTTYLLQELRTLRSRLDDLTGDQPEAEEAGEPAAPEELPPEPEPEPGVPHGGSRPSEPTPAGTYAEDASADSPGTEGSPASDRKSLDEVLSGYFAGIDWESFAGVKLFAWIGGLALFLGMIFLLRHAYTAGWINPTPRTRVIGAFLLGTALLVGSVLIRRKQYRVTMHTFAASGAAVLYADVYAAYAYYHFIPNVVAFALMVLVTVTTFLLADRLRSIYVALLGLLGGFLTPPLLATGTDNPIGLFSYIALLDGALVVLALRRRWHFLVTLAAAGTFVTEWGWAGEYFSVQKAWIGGLVFVFFAFLFAASHRIGQTLESVSKWTFYPAVLMPLLSMSFIPLMLSMSALGRAPWIVLSVLLLLGAAGGWMAIRDPKARGWHLLAGAVSFFLLLGWTDAYLTESILYWGLSYYLAFGVLYGGLPVVVQRIQGEGGRYLWGHLYPSLMLLLMLFPVLRGDLLEVGLWPFVLLLCLVGMLLSWLMCWAGGVLLNLLVVMGGSAYWIYHLPGTDLGLLSLITPVVLFSLVFFAGGLMFSRLVERAPHLPDSGLVERFDGLAEKLPALSALLPYLLVVVMVRSLADPPVGVVFGLSLMMTVLLFALVVYRDLDILSLVSLVAVGLVEFTWHTEAFDPLHRGIPLLWYGLFYALFLLFPFGYEDRFRNRRWPWVASALAGVVQFLLFYDLFTASMGDSFIGLLPVSMALITAAPLYRVTTLFSQEDESGRTVIAWFAGVTLLFVSLVFPLQFEKQWVTVGWALEGTALLWLYRRLPHRGLRRWGVGLLVLAFVRLALNPAVLDYYPRTSAVLLNWYLYSYGVVALCLFWASSLIDVEPKGWLRDRARRYFPALGTILLFLLLNIEIADYFSTGASLTFDFAGSFAQDATYSVAWALFAFVMLLVGGWRENRMARVASLGLLGVTTLKVFLHDLWRLGEMYRVASLIGLAVVLIVVSVLYQRFFARESEA